MMKRTLAALAAIAVLAGCSSAEDPAESIRLGSFDASGAFREGVLEISTSVLSSGEAATIAAALVDRQGRIVQLGAPLAMGPADGLPDGEGSPTLSPNRVSQQGISAIFAPLSPSELTVNITSGCIRANRAQTDLASFGSGLALLAGSFGDQGCTGQDLIELSVFVTRTNQRLTATQVVNINDPVRAARLGSLDMGGQFSEGTVQIGAANLSAGGTTTFSVVLADVGGQPLMFGGNPDGLDEDGTGVEAPGAFFGRLQAAEITQQATLPGCGGRATIAFDPIELSGPAILTGTIQDAGCATTSALNVAVTLARDGVTRTATSQINIADAGLLGIESRDLSLTELRVRGIPNAVGSATATFQVTVPDTPAANAEGRLVRFALQGGSGVASLASSTALTNSEGAAVATIMSGSVPGLVSVIATVDDPASGLERSTQSPSLRIANGLPIQGRLGLSATCNNIEAASVDGGTVDLQILAQDVSGRPVVDGTEVAFLTNGGALLDDCVLSAGSCLVTFRAQAPRPAGGIVTILAHTQGQESFLDENGNGRRDQGEPFADQPEAFLDANGNGIRDGGEPFVDLNDDGAYSPGNGEFDGYRCAGNSCTVSSVSVSDATQIAFSSGQSATQLGQIVGATLDPQGVVVLPRNSVVNLALIVKDINGLPLPAQTSLSLVAEGPAGLGVVIANNQQTADCDSSPADAANTYGFSLNVSDVEQGATGQLRLTTVSPAGTATVFVQPIRVQ